MTKPCFGRRRGQQFDRGIVERWRKLRSEGRSAGSSNREMAALRKYLLEHNLWREVYR